MNNLDYIKKVANQDPIDPDDYDYAEEYSDEDRLPIPEEVFTWPEIDLSEDS